MNRSWISLPIILAAVALGWGVHQADPGLGWVFSPRTGFVGGSSGDATVTVVAGTATPQSEDNLHPSMSRWDPSCGIPGTGSWGTGCNTVTQTCTAPSSGTPDQPCQAPLQFVVDPSRSSGNGTTATIAYTSTAGYTFALGQPFNVKNATTTQWNTQIARVTSYSLSTGSPCTVGHQCVTLGFTPTLATAFRTDIPTYIGGIKSSATSTAGFGWNGCTVTAGSYSAPNATITFTGGCTFAPGDLIRTNGLQHSPGISGEWNFSSVAVVSATPTTVTFAAPSDTYTGGGQVFSLNQGQQGPNTDPSTLAAASTTSISYDVNAAFPTGIVGSFGSLNDNGYNGTATQPWVVTASACGDSGDATKCHVSFSNTTACASSCVTTATQIVAAQFNDPIIAWDTGPIAPFAVEGVSLTNYPGHLVRKCVDAISLSHGPTTPIFYPMQAVAFALDGGPFVKATTPQLDPWGVGNNATGDKTNNTQVYCAQFDSSLVADGLHELRACAIPVAGPVSCLTSAIAAETANGSSTLGARAHMLSDTFRVAVTKSQDPAFHIFNGGLQTSSNITITGATWHNDAPTCGSGNCIVYTFSQPTTTPPIPAGTIVNISGSSSNNSCPISSMSGDGQHITYTYTGGCNFPVGSNITESGITPVATVDTSTACTYTSGTGDVAMTIPSATWGASPLAGMNYTLAGFTGLSSGSINGSRPLASSASAGTILHFTVGTGLTITNCTGAGGPTVASNAYTVTDTCTTCGTVFAAEVGPAVTATDGVSTVTVAGMSMGVASSGSIKADWDGHCITTAGASGTITCPTLASSSTLSSFGSIQVNANAYVVAGGEGDLPPPFNPAHTGAVTLTGDSFQIIPFLSDTGDYQGNHTGCTVAPCGVAATTNSTIWLSRIDAGTAEIINAANQRAMGMINDGSMWIYTNAGGGIQETDAYADPWNPSAVSLGCSGTHHAASDWNETGPTYGGSYCTSIIAGVNTLDTMASTPTETIANSGGCTTFTATANSGLYPGQPIDFFGLDKGAAGDGSNGAFQTGQYYWISTKTSNTVTLAATPNGPCINETAALLSTVTFQFDLSFDNIYVKCNTTYGCSGDNTNPESIPLRTAGGTNNWNALGGWFSVLADTGNGTPDNSVALISGGVDSWQLNTGRVHTNLIMNWLNNVGTVTPVVAIPQIPGSPSGYGAVTITSGSLSTSPNTCPGPTCIETLAYTIADTPGGGHYTNAVFQTPTTSAPGQGLVVQHITNTGGAGSSDWNCGSSSAPCFVTASTSTSSGGISSGTVSFINPTADGTYASSTSNPIVPVTLNIEVAKGTIGGTWNGGQLQCANTTTHQSFDFSHLTPVPRLCLAGLTSPSGIYGSTNAFGVIYGDNKVYFSNCISTNNAGFTFNSSPTITQMTPSNGTTNDVITISNGTSAPLFTYNACGTDPWNFAPNNIQANRVNDTWTDSVQNEGPSWSTTGVWQIGFNTNGVNYVTNGFSYDNNSAFDNEGYTWGSTAIWNTGSCHDHGGVSFHTRCISSADVIPPGPPLWGWQAQNPPHITHSYATYADYLTGPTAEITCSGVPCVAGSGQGDGGKTSHIYTLDKYGVSRFFTLSFENYILCNLYPAGVAGGGVGDMRTVKGNTINSWQSTDFDGSNAVVEISASAGSTNPDGSPNICTDGPTGNASMGWFPVTHADTNFNLVNQPGGGPDEIPGSGNATMEKDTIYSDQDTTGTGNAEGIFSKGPNMFMNTAVNFSTTSSNQYPGSTGIKALSLENPAVNRLFMNTNIYGFNFYAPDFLTRAFGVKQQSGITEVYMINDQLVPVGTTTPNNGYPYAGTIDPDHTGLGTIWDTADAGIWTPGAGADSACGGQQGTATQCGGIQNLVVFPSEAFQASQTTGVTLEPGTPNSYSLGALPWYGPATDSGGGLY